MPLKFLVIDDHTLFREGLCHLLHQFEENMTILEASHHKEAFELLASNSDIDLVLLDLCMPEKDGFTILKESSQKFPSTPIVILSASKDRSDMQRVMDDGAVGYIPKDATGKLMLSAIQVILAGGLYIPIDLVNQPKAKPIFKSTDALTPRQTEVLLRMARGLSNKVIAAELGISESTIKMHVTSVMKNLGVTNRTQAVLAAQKLGVCL